jgi:hypothetical protein
VDIFKITLQVNMQYALPADNPNGQRWYCKQSFFNLKPAPDWLVADRLVSSRNMEPKVWDNDWWAIGKKKGADERWDGPA